jgi:uncharacterized protein YabN with tetrapyrrole methylase and pyrophosphatase domain
MPLSDRDSSFTDLVAIIEKLRGKDGCPWDQRQNPASLKKYLLEESRELAEAINRADGDHICEEIGDLMYILIMLALMHEERGEFTLAEALGGIARKMIRRHPHVFAGEKAGSDHELRRQWEEIKAAEKSAEKGQASDR